MTTESKSLSASGNTQLIRPRYSAGLMLQDDDLTQAVDYARELNRLMFRSLLGCGVVCGLEVTLHKKGLCTAIHIAPGLALTGCGDPIHVPTEQIIPLNSDCSNQDVVKTLWVVIRRTDHFCMPRDLACSSDEDANNTIYTRLRDGFEILLEKGDAARSGACGSPKTTPPEDPKKTEWYLKYIDGKCDCNCNSEWVVLAVVEDIDTKQEDGSRYGNHSVRRFLRPQLMFDPVPTRPQPTKPEAKEPDALGQARIKAFDEWKAAEKESEKAGASVEALKQKIADPANAAQKPALEKDLAGAEVNATKLTEVAKKLEEALRAALTKKA